MSVRNVQAAFQQGQPARAPADDSDVEQETLASDYKEQVQYEDNDLDRVPSIGSGPQDLQAQLAAAAQPLEYQATLETKIASYDSYCNLFHYILNSDGPVDLEVPSVRKRHPSKWGGEEREEREKQRMREREIYI